MTASGPAPTSAERLLGRRLEQVVYGGAAEATVPGVVLERTRAGSALARRAGGRAIVSTRDDAILELAVRGRLAADPQAGPSAIDVDAQGGVVQLTGSVDGPEQAARLLRVALDTDGVRAVEARLFWTPAREHTRLERTAVP